MNWIEHVDKWKNCKNCPLGAQRGVSGRICLARGTLPCQVLFIGEAPGTSENAIGQPFVGPAGQLLDQIVERSLDIKTVTTAYTNLVACFPREAKERGDNEPDNGEILECRPRLIEFVNIAKPCLVVNVGKLAERYFPGVGRHTPNVTVDHPAYILRMPLAQQQMAIQRCIVRIRNAYEDVLQSPEEFKTWEERIYDAKDARSKRQRLRDLYDDYGDIPF